MRNELFPSILKKEPILLCATILSLISIIFVPIQSSYSTYFDWKTISCLFCLMLVIAAFRKMHLFTKLSMFFLTFAKTPRQISGLLVFLTFFFSMVITNDVALLTFVPLTIVIFSMSNAPKPILFTIVLQTIAANVGSAMTPFWNHQKQFLYIYYAMDLDTY